MAVHGRSDTVAGRIASVRADVPVGGLLVAAGLAVALGALLLFVQDPLVHDALHNFRHAAGVTCH